MRTAILISAILIARAIAGLPLVSSEFIGNFIIVCFFVFMIADIGDLLKK